jgi:peroxiredoxin
MFCKDCGKQNNGTDPYCTACGASLLAEDPPGEAHPPDTWQDESFGLSSAKREGKPYLALFAATLIVAIVVVVPLFTQGFGLLAPHTSKASTSLLPGSEGQSEAGSDTGDANSPISSQGNTDASGAADPYAGKEVGIDIGDIAPDFTLELRGGGSFRLSDLRGKPTLLNLSTTWCPPCIKEFPEIQKVYDAYKGKVNILGVDQQEEAAVVDAYFDQYPSIVYPIAYDPSGNTFGIYQNDYIPTTYILDKDGIIVASFVGGQDFNAFDRVLKGVLP